MNGIAKMIDVTIQCRGCYRQMDKLTPWCTTSSTYGVQVFYCPICGVYVKIVADTTDKATVERLLDALENIAREKQRELLARQKPVDLQGYARPTKEDYKRALDELRRTILHEPAKEKPNTTP